MTLHPQPSRVTPPVTTQVVVAWLPFWCFYWVIACSEHVGALPSSKPVLSPDTELEALPSPGALHCEYPLPPPPLSQCHLYPHLCAAVMVLKLRLALICAMVMSTRHFIRSFQGGKGESRLPCPGF